MIHGQAARGRRVRLRRRLTQPVLVGTSNEVADYIKPLNTKVRELALAAHKILAEALLR